MDAVNGMGRPTIERSTGEGAAVRPSGDRESTQTVDAGGGTGPFLRHPDERGHERTYPLEQDRAVTIGRSEDADVSLHWDQSVSSIHAEVRQLGGHWLVSDEGISRNGTFVNGERIGGQRRLRRGDVIRVGHTTLGFHEAREHREATTIIDVVGSMGTVTVLFTDVVGSTELMNRIGDDAADRVRREHFATLTDAASPHGGQVVKNLGDGLMLAFGSTLGAVACSVTMQQQVAARNKTPTDHAMGLRIGLNVGEAISADGDYFGTPVVVAKRLCDRAEPGQTLLSDIVRALVGSRGGFRFKALGPLSLKGIADPVGVCELDWSSHPREGERSPQA